MTTVSSPRPSTRTASRGITEIRVRGFKSIKDETAVDIRPLTLLAGANSSGKSSIMQPLLLLKQTLEAPYDPGALLLDGPNVTFTSVDQVLTKSSTPRAFAVGFTANAQSITSTYSSSGRRKGFEVTETVVGRGLERTLIRRDMSAKELLETNPHMQQALDEIGGSANRDYQLAARRNRSYLQLRITVSTLGNDPLVASVLPLREGRGDTESQPRQIIHLPGLRGNPARTYQASAVGPSFPGTFDKYVASIITDWQTDRPDKLVALGNDLQRLGLTWKVSAQPINDTQVELRVGRLPRPARGGAHDLVSIADVGFGVSQTLPVLVALSVARPGQLVYLEQPEIHLHPKAQVELAGILADAARRGVRVVAETHSSLLLLAVQALVAEGTLPSSLVKLHWFTRDIDGCTRVTSADLTKAGAFGDWPEDFGDVLINLQSRYLDASERSSHGRRNGG